MWMIETRKAGDCTLNNPLQSKECLGWGELEEAWKMWKTWHNSWECDLAVANTPQTCQIVLYIGGAALTGTISNAGMPRAIEVKKWDLSSGRREMRHLNDFCNLISRNKLHIHICLRSGFWETDQEMRFYWGVFSEATPVRGWRRRTGQEEELNCHVNSARTSADSHGFSWAGCPFRRVTLWGKDLSLYIPTWAS